MRPVGDLTQESNAGHSRRVPMPCPSEFSRPTCNFPVERIDKPADNKTLSCLAAATDAISRLMIRRLGEGARSYWLGLISAGRREPATSPVPLLAPLPLHGDAGRITDLDPDRARPDQPTNFLCLIGGPRPPKLDIFTNKVGYFPTR
jgi:hypothetical protein